MPEPTEKREQFEQEARQEFLPIKDDIARKLDEVFKSEFQYMEKREYEVEEITEAREKLLKREEQFFVRVLTAARMAEERSPGNAIVLFDIDETIGTANFDEGKDLVTKLRPSLIPLLEKFKTLNLEVGFLSSRGKESMDKQLGDENNLGPIKEYVNPNLVFSSRKYSSGDSRNFRDKLHEGSYEVIDVSLVEAEGEFGGPTTNGEQQKIKALQEIKEQNPEKSFVVVDDINYPKFLNEKNGIFGVSLADGNGAFYKP
jgi:flagellar biosynthesis/type III secretory pathway chaperone